MKREVTVGHMLFTVSVKDGEATWSVRPSEAVENTQTKVLFSGCFACLDCSKDVMNK